MIKKPPLRLIFSGIADTIRKNERGAEKGSRRISGGSDVLTGDNIASTTLIKPYARLAMHQYMSILEKLGTPVVMVYGNHDDERTTANKAYQMSVYEKYKCFIGCAGEDFGESNLGTYYVPIYSSADENEMVNNIWMIDSGTYNDENDLGGYRDDNNGIQYEKQQSLL